MASKSRKPLTYRHEFVVVPAEEFDFDAVTDFLAEAMARAYAEDHPELFRPIGEEPQATGGREHE